MSAAPQMTPTPSEPAALSLEETRERTQLQQDLRVRRSVDQVARGWYSGLGALILTAIVGHNVHDDAPKWLLGCLGGATIIAWGFTLLSAARAVRLIGVEGKKLRRLAELDVRAPKPPELF